MYRLFPLPSFPAFRNSHNHDCERLVESSNMTNCISEMCVQACSMKNQFDTRFCAFPCETFFFQNIFEKHCISLYLEIKALLKILGITKIAKLSGAVSREDFLPKQTAAYEKTYSSLSFYSHDYTQWCGQHKCFFGRENTLTLKRPTIFCLGHCPSKQKNDKIC